MRMCSIASGSSGNCIYVGSDNHHLLIDAGISGKRVEAGLKGLELSGKDIDGILLTHEHSDHIKGLGVLARKYGLPIYATPGTADGGEGHGKPWENRQQPVRGDTRGSGFPDRGSGNLTLSHFP